MFSFFSRKKKSGAKPGDLLKVDMHGHFVPGVDDGAPDVETALEMVAEMHSLGYEKLIVTPHIYKELYDNSLETLQPAFDELKAAVQRENIPIQLHLAAEYMMDESFSEKLEKKEKLLTVSQNLVLVELPFTSPPFGWKEQLFALQINGYQPILAHPERYNFAYGNKKYYQEFIDAGCLLQLNLLSIAGYYGPDALASARYLLKNRMISLMGTDTHHHRHLKSLSDGAIAEAIESYGQVLNHSLN